MVWFDLGSNIAVAMPYFQIEVQSLPDRDWKNHALLLQLVNISLARDLVIMGSRYDGNLEIFL